MKKIVALFISLAIVALLITSCGNNSYSVPTGMQIASDTEIVDYLLYVPKDWKVDMRTGVTTAYYSVNDPSNISVTMSTLGSQVGGLDAYFEEHLKTLEEVFDVIGDVESANLILSNEAANQYVYSAKFDGVEYKFWQVICIHSGRVYTVTYSSTDMQTALDLFCFIK